MNSQRACRDPPPPPPIEEHSTNLRRYFRRFPEHLERFCGREARAEPLHYAPSELKRDSEFTSRSLMHGLAQLQVILARCYAV